MKINNQILMMIIVFPFTVSDQEEYEVNPPVYYSVLSNDLILSYKLAENHKLLDKIIFTFVKTSSHVYSKQISSKEREGILRINCGIIYQPGNYSVQMLRRTNDNLTDSTFELLAEAAMLVKFPSFKITVVEDRVQTYPLNFRVSIKRPKSLCQPKVADTADTTKLEVSTVSHSTRSEQRNVIYTRTLPVWYRLQSGQLEIPCFVFDHQAQYQIRVVASFLSENSIKSSIISSAPVSVIWNHKYKMEIPLKLIPCSHELKIYHRSPSRCSDNSGDRIKLYGLLKPNVSSPMAPPAGMKYVKEHRITETGFFVLPCSLLKPFYSTFCFKYVARGRNGATYEVQTICRPLSTPCHGDGCSYKNVLPAKWSEWSTWSSCSQTCGHRILPTASQTRRRICISGFSRGYETDPLVDESCPGIDNQSRRCYHVVPCPVPSTTISPMEMLRLDECTCGCNITVNSDQQLRPRSGTFQTTTKLCPSNSLWLIRSKSYQVSLEFSYFDIMYTHQWVEVRDGDNVISPLLALATGKQKMEKVSSTSGVLRIEFLNSYQTSYNDTYGFIAHYAIIEPEVHNVDPPVEETTLGLTPVHLLVVAVFVFVFLTICGFVVFRSYFKSRGRFERYDSVQSCSSAGSLESVVAVTPLTSPQRRKRLRRMKAKILNDCVCPEDFLQDAKYIFGSPPEKRRPVATITPQPIRSRYPSTSTTDGEVVMRTNRAKPRFKVQRESQTPLTASMSEISVGGDEYEYDYYDIGGHYEIGSYFNADEDFGWQDPQFDPRPSRVVSAMKKAADSEIVPLKQFSYSGDDSHSDKSAVT